MGMHRTRHGPSPHVEHRRPHRQDPPPLQPQSHLRHRPPALHISGRHANRGRHTRPPTQRGVDGQHRRVRTKALPALRSHQPRTGTVESAHGRTGHQRHTRRLHTRVLPRDSSPHRRTLRNRDRESDPTLRHPENPQRHHPVGTPRQPPDPLAFLPTAAPGRIPPKQGALG